MYLQICGSFESANHKKSGSTNRKSAKCQICGRFANLTNYLKGQCHEIFDFRFSTWISFVSFVSFASYVLTALNSVRGSHRLAHIVTSV
jgi:hypothetical protein